MCETTYDVAIVGGGVIGSSIAFQLAKRGASVIIIEKREIGCEASGAAAGMLGAQSEFSSDHPLIPLALKSRELFPHIADELKDLTGIDIGLIQKGLIQVASTDEQLQGLIDHYKFWRDKGEDAHWLDEQDLRKLEPHVQSVKGAMYLPKDGQVRATDLTRAFHKAAQTLGAVSKEHTEVLDMIHEKKVVKGVQTKEGTIYANSVVIAGGAWTSRLLHMKTIYPVKGECVSFVTNEPLLQATVFAKDGCYIVPKKGNRLFIGATSVLNTFDKSVSVCGMSFLLHRAQSLIPKIKEAKIEKIWSGIRPQTEDTIPYMGEHPSIKGVWVAAGHYRNGILLSPITGMILADLIEGRETDFDLSPFQLDRKPASIG